MDSAVACPGAHQELAKLLDEGRNLVQGRNERGIDVLNQWRGPHEIIVNYLQAVFRSTLFRAVFFCRRANARRLRHRY